MNVIWRLVKLFFFTSFSEFPHADRLLKDQFKDDFIKKVRSGEKVRLHLLPGSDREELWEMWLYLLLQVNDFLKLNFIFPLI